MSSTHPFRGVSRQLKGQTTRQSQSDCATQRRHCRLSQVAKAAQRIGVVGLSFTVPNLFGRGELSSGCQVMRGRALRPMMFSLREALVRWSIGPRNLHRKGLYSFRLCFRATGTKRGGLVNAASCRSVLGRMQNRSIKNGDLSIFRGQMTSPTRNQMTAPQPERTVSTPVSKGTDFCIKPCLYQMSLTPTTCGPLDSILP